MVVPMRESEPEWAELASFAGGGWPLSVGESVDLVLTIGLVPSPVASFLFSKLVGLWCE